jgi:hypothetical protein
LGKKSLGTSEFPPIETLIATGNVAFRQHASGHTDQPNWPYYLDFACFGGEGLRYLGCGGKGQIVRVVKYRKTADTGKNLRPPRLLPCVDPA